jgi:hypothetical protein
MLAWVMSLKTSLRRRGFGSPIGDVFMTISKNFFVGTGWEQESEIGARKRCRKSRIILG